MWTRDELKSKGTSIKLEALGGLSTFMTMSYIILIHPNVMADAGMDKEAMIAITCLVSFLATLIVAIWANVPFAMAPGMGLNAFFSYSLVLGMNIPIETALGVVFLSGFFFLILTLFGAREKIAQAIPHCIKHATGAGIGLFIAFIGFQKMGLVEANEVTFVQMGKMDRELIIGLIGLLAMIILEVKRMRGAIMIGIFGATIIAYILGLIEWPSEAIRMPSGITLYFMKLDILAALQWSLISVIFSFMFVDLFDSIGTIFACSYEANLVEDGDQIPALNKILRADALATVIGALMGSSTTTTYIESASGISAGARTGLSSIFTASMFAVALFFTPLINMVPDYAVAPALVIVGVFMFKSIRRIELTDLTQAIPAFLTMLLMPLTYNISHGLVFGFLSYILIMILNGKMHLISFTLWIIGLLCMINLFLI